MRTYQQRTSGQQPQGLNGIRAAAQHSPLQRAIDTGARMQAQQQRVGALNRQTVLQAKKPAWLVRLLASDKTKTAIHVATQTTTAHSPGIYTGPVNSLAPVSISLNAVDKYQGLTEAGKLANTNMGYSTVAASALGDVVGGALSIKTMVENGPLGNTNWNSPDYATKKETRAAFKSAATDLSGQVLDAGSQISSTLGSVSQAGTIAAQVAPFGAGVVNLGVGIRAAVSAERARNYYNNLETLEAQGGEPLREQVAFAKGQMGKRKWRQRIGAVGAALGTGGAIALGVAGLGLGAVALATPIGWALAGAGAAVALGIGAYKAYRYIKKKRATSANEMLGAERNHHATEIINALHTDLGYVPLGQGTQAEQEYKDKVATRTKAEQLLAARGINPHKLRAADKQKSIEYLERKLKSW